MAFFQENVLDKKNIFVHRSEIFKINEEDTVFLFGWFKKVNPEEFPVSCVFIFETLSLFLSSVDYGHKLPSQSVYESIAMQY